MSVDGSTVSIFILFVIVFFLLHDLYKRKKRDEGRLRSAFGIMSKLAQAQKEQSSNTTRLSNILDVHTQKIERLHRDNKAYVDTHGVTISQMVADFDARLKKLELQHDIHAGKIHRLLKEMVDGKVREQELP